MSLCDLSVSVRCRVGILGASSHGRILPTEKHKLNATNAHLNRENNKIERRLHKVNRYVICMKEKATQSDIYRHCSSAAHVVGKREDGKGISRVVG